MSPMQHLLRMRRLLSIPGTLLALSLVACASNEPQIFTAFDPLMPFPAEATYVWDEAANSLPENPNVREANIGPLIESLATEAMAARGYKAVQGGTPPYRLSYQMEVYTWISQQQSTSTAALALRLTDYATKKTVWLGSMSLLVDLGRTEAERTALLKATFERLLANFPPSQPHK